MSPQTAARWTQIVAIISFATALLIAAAAHPPLAGGAVLLFDVIDWPIDGAVAAFTKEARLLSAIGGGIFAGMSAMFLLIVAPALKRGDEDISKAALAALLVWYVVDCAGSFAAGVSGNVVFNTLYLITAIPPLLLLKTSPDATGRGRSEANA